jgi:hypothetical protein
MCRSIKVLFNLDPPATEEEINAASLQFVRKLSGFHEPSKANETAFNTTVEEVAVAAKKLLNALTAQAEPHNRDVETAKAHARALKRFGIAS